MPIDSSYLFPYKKLKLASSCYCTTPLIKKRIASTPVPKCGIHLIVDGDCQHERESNPPMLQPPKHI